MHGFTNRAVGRWQEAACPAALRHYLARSPRTLLKSVASCLPHTHAYRWEDQWADMQAAHRVMAAGMRNEFVGETAARAGGRPRGCFCPQCGQVNHKMGEWWCCGEGSGRSTGRLIGWMAVTWFVGWLVVSWLVEFCVGDRIDVVRRAATSRHLCLASLVFS